jgi:hypothetical protein
MSDSKCNSDSTPVEYRSIPGFPNYRVGNDGSVWSKFTGDWKQLSPSRATNGYYFVGLCRKGFRMQRNVHRLVLEAFAGPCPNGMEARHFPDRDQSNNTIGNLSWATREVNMGDQRTHGTIKHGEEKHNASMSEETAKEIVRLLKETTLFASEIAAKFGVNVGRVAGGGKITRPKISYQGSRVKSSKLTDWLVMEIRQRAITGTPYLDLAKEYGVSEPVIFNITHGKTWRHAGGPIITQPRKMGRCTTKKAC